MWWSRGRTFSTCVTLLERLRTQAVPLRSRKVAKAWNDVTVARNRQNNSFADWRRCRVIGGDGGDGCISTLSVFAQEFAGPDGGDGGHGGHVIFKASFSHFHALV